MRAINLTMELYETELCELQQFIEQESIEKFTDKYLILYNFAIDCKYSKNIQPELIKSVVPFYLKTMDEAVFGGNKTAMDIYCEFNLAIFFNQKNFMDSIGGQGYQNIMTYYIEQTLRKMEMKSNHLLEGVSLFNTTIAMGSDNIQQLFHKILNGSLRIKYSFFRYLSVLLFKESDNLLAVNETEEYWSSDIWDFDDGYFTRELFWRNDAVLFFDREVNRGRIEELFSEIKPLIYETLEPELVEVLYEEVCQSFATGIFYNRKAEYLEKMNDVSKKYTYWETTF